MLTRLPYTLLWILALPLVLLRLAWRARRQPAYLRHVDERFGRYRTRAPVGVIWVHAVSVGETRAAEPLVRALLAEWPEHSVLLTHMTPTGRDTSKSAVHGRAARAARLPALRPRLLRPRLPAPLPPALRRDHGDRAVAQPARRLPPPPHPGDARQCPPVGTLGAPLRPPAGAHRADPEGARRDRRADRRRRRPPHPARRAPGHGDRQHQVRHRPAGGDARPRPQPARSASASARSCSPPAPARARRRCCSTPSCARRHPRLCCCWCRATRSASTKSPQLASTRGLALQRRSADEAVAAQTRVLLGDSMGEMFAYYAAADVALIGGSWLPFGGQNLIEACAVGTAVVIGPHTFNFQAVAADAERAGAAVRAQDADAGMRAALALIADPARRAAGSPLRGAPSRPRTRARPRAQRARDARRRWA